MTYDLIILTTRGQKRGKWLGNWKMSKGAEKMLRRMIQPNADQRCTAPEVLQDPYGIGRADLPERVESTPRKPWRLISSSFLILRVNAYMRSFYTFKRGVCV